MLATFLSTALVCGLTALVCPTDKDAQTQASVQTVGFTPEKSDCPLACKGEKATVQNVALTGEKDECAKACDGDKNAASIQNVALTGDKGECEKARDGQKTAFAAPAMAYRVGDETLTCPMTAKSIAEKSHSEMSFVVSGVAYEAEADAKAAHAAEMQRFADSLTRVSFVINGQKTQCADTIAKACDSAQDMKVQYQVGPAVFDSAEEAVRAAAAAYSAMQAVSMTYAVNGETTHCSIDAAAKSKACGSPVEYMVNGQKAGCGEDARYMLIREQVAAAVAAVQKSIG